MKIGKWIISAYTSKMPKEWEFGVGFHWSVSPYEVALMIGPWSFGINWWKSDVVTGSKCKFIVNGKEVGTIDDVMDCTAIIPIDVIGKFEPMNRGGFDEN